MDDIELLFDVDYYCGPDKIAEQSATRFIPRKGDQVQFSKDGDTYVAEIFEVENVLIVIPESDAETYTVMVNLEAT